MLRHQLRARVGQRLSEVSLRGKLGDHRVKVATTCAGKQVWRNRVFLYGQLAPGE